MTKERPPLDDMTLRQLRRVASELGISRYSRMRKDGLLASIRAKLPPAAVQTSSGPARTLEAQEEVEAAKFEVGQNDLSAETLASVDEGLPDLPAGYGESRIVLMPRDPQWAYAYWDVPNANKEELRRQGGQQLALRIYDVTDLNLSFQRAHSVQEYPCDELAREWYLPIPVSDRDYTIDIGYRCADGRWLVLARSAPVRVPPVYPSDWIEDTFASVEWDRDLRGSAIAQLTAPSQRALTNGSLHETFYDEEAEAKRVAGSMFGSMQHVPGSHVPGSHVPGSGVAGSIQQYGEQAVSSYALASGVGMWASGVGPAAAASGAGLGYTASGVGQAVSGAGLGYAASGAGLGYTASGVGYAASGAGLGYAASGAGLGYTASGVGYAASGAGLGYAASGMGLGYTASGMGLGYTASGVGYAASGAGLGYTASGAGLGYTASGAGLGYSASGIGYAASGAGLGMWASGMGMSGAGFSASAPPLRPRQFWLVADAELIVYGATEPDATVTIGGRPIKLNPDGTFRFQMSFQDGVIDYPIMAVASDGEQTRSIHMKFERQTPSRHTNTKEEAVLEWLS